MRPSSVGGPLGSTVRWPRLEVLANGTAVGGVTSARVVNNAYFAADRFDISVALGADPTRGAAWWDEQKRIIVDIGVTLGGTCATLLHGQVDAIDIDAVHNVATLSGRDLSAGLIEARVQETFANRTASEIATIIAERHGLDADVRATTSPVGRYWQLEHDSIVLDAMARSTTEWDLLVALGQCEGVTVGVSGRTLHFRPLDDAPVPMLLEASACSRLHLARSLVIGGGVSVTVRSWNCKKAQRYEHQFESASVGPDAKEYVYVAPNLTPDTASSLAAQRLAEISRGATELHAEMPGETALAPGMQILLEGTASSFDCAYVVDVIEREMDFRKGFTERLRAHSA